MVWRIVHLCGVAGRQYDLHYINEKACRHRRAHPMALLAGVVGGHQVLAPVLDPLDRTPEAAPT